MVNTSGTDIDVIQTGSEPRITILNGKDFMLRGIANANVLSVRRTDRTNAQVSVVSRWES
ncbi:hypothetical protein [Spirosoma endbachense]|uniref:Uncharacterized protein n=1 Tax=Spirosoma endbachense TaxID=2666025 RepID=A0A6P1VN32_9BACT|nr:hypothetical protein [Spirosoma endbachense]QHV94004.1 hypothetical protein GJR95_02725 [Spirosoma endbachense]